ncbi:hypothetical protein BC941DRAFT_450535 [Chlamydoabsidia padenii]|nr:hypothetical protein BC941DRAFT_450535 [Chlamydoabsidia padenii]
MDQKESVLSSILLLITLVFSIQHMGTHDHTQTNLKPDTIDTPTFEKPNAYDELEVTSEQVDDLALGVQATRLDNDKKEQDDDGEEPFLTTIVRYKTKKTKMAPPPTLPAATWSSSTLLSHVSSTTSTTNTILADDDLQPRRPLSSSSFDQQSISPSLSTTSTTDSLQSTTSSKQLLLDSLKRRPMSDVAKYDIRKHALGQPHHHDIYIGGTKHLLFRKRQPHSYSWGFQNILYRVEPEKNNKAPYGTKVAEARRRAFQKQITLEWGMDDNNNNNNNDDDDDSRVYNGTDGAGDDDDDDDESKGIRSNQLVNTNNTRLLFVYTTVFETDYCIRWKRPSLSHDMVCEIRLLEENDDGTKKHKKKWQLLAEFNSNLMGYLVNIGQLAVDKRVLALVDRPDHLEAHLLITCCTLVDLMREVVQKAVGLSDGGVA